MKNLNQLQQELKDLQVALKNKDISVNDYSTMYMTISKRIKEMGG